MNNLKYKMNNWLKLSVEYAQQRNYLDDLFRVYPTIPDGIRDISADLWKNVEVSFEKKDNIALFNNLLKLDLFPIKDSYVAFLKRDKKAITRNPNTVNRLCGRIYEIGIEKLYEKCSEPKETNRQIGPLFKKWVDSGALGIQSVGLKDFVSNSENAILNANDNEMMIFAKQNLGYNRNKGLDFVARFNKKYVIGEAKFLTDFGGHQNAQFNDALDTIKYTNCDVLAIAILDGVLYIDGKNKMYKSITQELKNSNILSALVLRDFLYSL